VGASRLPRLVLAPGARGFPAERAVDSNPDDYCALNIFMLACAVSIGKRVRFV